MHGFQYSILILAILLIGSSTTAGQSRLHVMTLEAPPMVIVDDDTITGMAADLAVAGLIRAGFEPFIEIAPWQRAVYMTRHGLADALFYAVYNDERAKYFHYPEIPLFTIDLVALKRTDSDIVITPDFKGLNRWNLGIGRGFAYGPKLQKFMDKARFNRIEPTTSNDLNFRKLLDNRIDILVADKALARYFLEQKESLGRADYVRNQNGEIYVFDQLKAYLVFSRKTSTALDAKHFTEALESMIEEGTYQKIIDKYQ